MASRPNQSEKAILEQYRVAFENVSSNPEIIAAMASFGYDDPTIAEGKTIYEAARASYDRNKQEDVESKLAKQDFHGKWNSLKSIYSLHRKKVKIIFRKEPDMLIRLNVVGQVPRSYLAWLDVVKRFYATILADEILQQQVARLNITPDELTGASSALVELEKSRADYLRELGESEASTQKKNAALDAIDDWMGEFYAVAELALEGNLQLLEILGKFVRS